MTDKRGGARRAARKAGRVVFGDQRRVGLWIVPLMVMVALAGAVVAAGVTILVYSQRVESLREEVGGASAAAEEARTEIERLVEEFAADLDDIGATPSPGPTNAPADQGPNAAGVFAVAGPRTVGNAFAFFSDESQSFLVTTAAVVGGADRVEVYLPSGTVGAAVLGTDDRFGLATLRIDAPSIAPLRWRAPGEAVQPGDRGRVLGVAGPDLPAEVPVVVTGVGASDLLLDRGLPTGLSGAPVLDGRGDVVAVVARDDGTPARVVVVRAVCESLVSCAPADLGDQPPIGPPPTRVPAPPVPLAPAPAPAPAPPPPPPPAPAPATTPPAVPSPSVSSSAPSPSPTPASATPSPAPTG